MATTPTAGEGVPSPFRRIGLWFEQWAEAIDFDISEYHERRIARLEFEVAALRGKLAVSSDGASSLQPVHKEVS